MSETSYKKEQVVQIIGSVVHKMNQAQPLDQTLYQELEALKNAIDDMHEALHASNPNQIQSHIPSATDELDAIVSTTEDATNSIMTACEAIQQELADKPLDESAPIESQIIRIIEACTFQDLTGQRITKIIKALKEIDRHSQELSTILQSRFADLAPATSATHEKSEDEQLLNGPQLPGGGISQEEIDKLLSEF